MKSFFTLSLLCLSLSSFAVEMDCQDAQSTFSINDKELKIEATKLSGNQEIKEYFGREFLSLPDVKISLNSLKLKMKSKNFKCQESSEGFISCKGATAKSEVIVDISVKSPSGSGNLNSQATYSLKNIQLLTGVGSGPVTIGAGSTSVTLDHRSIKFAATMEVKGKKLPMVIDELISLEDCR